jgi:periplasmic divalent cation tolerance protein
LIKQNQLLIALCSAPDDQVADRLIAEILDARLAACVTRIPNVQSHYWWKNQKESALEVLLVLKTTEDRGDALKRHVLSHHPYQTPELIFLKVSDALEAYSAWVQAETR